MTKAFCLLVNSFCFQEFQMFHRHTTPTVSIVIPLFNEQGTLRSLYEELRQVCDGCGLRWQIVMVDDGSTDASWQAIREIAAHDSRVTGIRFRRNCGKAAALSAGFGHAQGDLLVMMDADLQDCPAELPRLLQQMETENLDLVSGWKKKRLDPWHKRYPSRGFNALVNWLSGLNLHDHNCGFKCFRRQVAESIELYGERHRFIPVLAAAQGFRVGESAVQHRPRQSGQSKYGWTRIPKGLLDVFTVTLLTRFQNRPLHCLGSMGLAAMAVAALCGAWLVIGAVGARLVGSVPTALTDNIAFYLMLLCVITATQLLTGGLLAELMVSTQSGQRASRASFAIAETTASHEGISLRKAA